MKESDLISVVIPVYNAEKYLRNCLKSLKSQTYTNLEIICINDGSTDKSENILNDLASKDHRIKVYNQTNQGAWETRKNGISKISNESKYFIFCDADDKLPYDSIEKMYNAIRLNESDICIGNTSKMYRDLVFKSKYIPEVFKNEGTTNYSHKEFVEKLYCSWFGISNVPVSLCAKMYNTSKFKEAMYSIPSIVHFFGEDLITTLNIFPLANKLTFINDVVYYYRIGGGTTKFQPLMMEDWIALYNYKKEFTAKYPMPQDIEYLMDVELGNMCFSYFEMLVQTSNYSKDKIVEEIDKTCKRCEIILCSNNFKIVENNLQKHKLIRENNVEGIYNLLIQKNMKRTLIKVIKNILLKLG